jgi:two-component system, NtrC family, C4-dicarboxylate transport response regulator DctD
MSDIAKVYLVDDDLDFREATKELLDDENIPTQIFDRGKAMLSTLDPEWDGVVLCDVKMPTMDGFEVLSAAQEIAPEVPFIMMTGHGDIPMAINAVKAGAYSFLEKPVQPAYLLSQINQALNHRKLMLENYRLRRRVLRFSDMGIYFMGTSKAIKLCRKKMLDVAPLPVPVMLYGEAGTGKALAARTIHEFSEVSGEFYDIDCGTLSEEELSRILLLPEHKESTIFLRALHQMPLNLQNILVGFLRQSKGPRIIASVKGDPAALLAEGGLGEELYYLFNVATIELPPLKERGKDISLLLDSFMQDAAKKFNKRRKMISPEQLQAFHKYDWPGNVRELRSAAERTIIGLAVDLKARPGGKTQGQNISYEQAMYDFEKSLLEQTLTESGGHKGEAAKLLSIPRKRLYLRLKSVGLLE